MVLTPQRRVDFINGILYTFDPFKVAQYHWGEYLTYAEDLVKWREIIDRDVTPEDVEKALKNRSAQFVHTTTTAIYNELCLKLSEALNS